jgi:hypothetical protein
MEEVILRDISFALDLEKLKKRLRIREGSRYGERLADMVVEAEGIAGPKAYYRSAYIEERGEEHVVVDDVRFKSRVLSVNLEGTHRVFPYVATCGQELEVWARDIDDVLLQFWAEAIKEDVLRAAIRALHADMEARYQPGRMAAMNPGSLRDWPIQEQRALFRLLGDPETAIGVRLTESCLMLPNKSVSGLRFPTEVSFENCQLCPREGCPGRRAPYDRALYDRRYRRVEDLETEA